MPSRSAHSSASPNTTRMHPVKLSVVPLTKKMYHCFSRSQALAALQAAEIAAASERDHSHQGVHDAAGVENAGLRPPSTTTSSLLSPDAQQQRDEESNAATAVSLFAPETAESSLVNGTFSSTTKAVAGVKEKKRRTTAASENRRCV